MISADLVALKQSVLEAEQEYRFWAATNTAGQTAERLVEIDIHYRQASRKYSDAMAAYDKAVAESIR